MAAFAWAVLQGIQVEISEQRGLWQKFVRSLDVARALVGEVATSAAIMPPMARSLSCYMRLPLFSQPHQSAPQGVRVAKDVRYGFRARNLLDVYVPEHVFQILAAKIGESKDGDSCIVVQPQASAVASSSTCPHGSTGACGTEGPLGGTRLHDRSSPLGGTNFHGGMGLWGITGPQGSTGPQSGTVPEGSAPPSGGKDLAPVIMFCHGGIWSLGDKWQFACMATRLAQAGIVVVVIQYTLYPKALADMMAEEVSDGITWTLENVQQYGGDPNRVTVMGHSAGAHLTSLALLLRARAAYESEFHLGHKVLPGATVRPTHQPQTDATPTHSNHHTPSLLTPADNSCLAPSHQMPACFVGMSGVYDLPVQYEMERMRGVHNMSTLCRANGGLNGLVPNSPAILLASAACQRLSSLQEGTSGSHHKEWLPLADSSGEFTPLEDSSGRGSTPLADSSVRGLSPLAGRRDSNGGEVHSNMGAGLRSNSGIAGATTSCSVGSTEGLPGREANCREGDTTNSTKDMLSHPLLCPGSRHHEKALNGSGIDGRKPGSLFDKRMPSTAGHSNGVRISIPARAICLESEALGGLKPYFSSFELEGDPIPVRCGLHDPHAVTALRSELSAATQQWLPLAAAEKLPPFVVMSSCADHMVPWHEGAQFVNTLDVCAVPARHLIYQQAQHNDFIFDWHPIRPGAHAVAKGAQHSTAGLAPFGKDLLKIVSGGPALLSRLFRPPRARL